MYDYQISGLNNQRNKKFKNTLHMCLLLFYITYTMCIKFYYFTKFIQVVYGV